MDDVVEAIADMERGCFMIVLKLAADDKGEMDKKNKNIGIEWNINNLHSDHKHITINSSTSKLTKINLSDIDKVTKLHRESANRVQKALNIDGIEQIGLQSVTLRLTLKESSDYNYFLIFDEYRAAFIWNRGLRTILHMISIKQPITTIAFCCSSIDRINNDEMHKSMKINANDNTFKWISHISLKLPLVQQHIYRCHQFAQASCILDSSEHLTLLLQAKCLKEMYLDAKKLSSIPLYQLTKGEITSLREVWLSLLADLTVAMLKEHQLRDDMKASRQNYQIKQQNLQISM